MSFRKVVLILGGIFILQFNAYANEVESTEPTDQYVLKIDGHNYPIELNKRTQLSVSLSNPEILLKVNPYKTFKYGGVFFKYPRYFTFEAYLDHPGVKMWSLSGNNAVILFQKFQTPIEHRDSAKLLAHKYGRENCKIEECEIIISGKSIQGSKVLVKLAGNSLSQQIFSFKAKHGTTLLILQDSLSHNGEFSVEGIALKKLIEKYFEIG